MADNSTRPKPIRLQDYSRRSQQRITSKVRASCATDEDIPHQRKKQRTSNVMIHSCSDSEEYDSDVSQWRYVDEGYPSTDGENVIIHDEQNSVDENIFNVSDSDGEEEEIWYDVIEDEAEVDENNAEGGYGEPNEDIIGDRPLYEGARITIAESLLAILTFFLRHSLTAACLADLLILVEMFCLAPNYCKKTLYLFRKYFENIRSSSKRQFYCSNCYSLLNEENGVEKRCEHCPAGTEICYFIHISIIEQLQILYRRSDFFHHLQSRWNRNKNSLNNYEDIWDGEIYRELINPPGILSNPNNISFTWNTDGVSLFKSSNFQIWPFFLSINELPFQERSKKENLILAGLWFGPKKPFPPAYLAPISNELKLLKDGVNFEVPSINSAIQVQAIVICGTCDLPAKGLFLNMKQFNGEHGCQKCKIRSEQFRDTHVRIYPFQRRLSHRTQEETNNFAAEALRLGEAVYGVKGPSAISPFSPSYIKSTTVDVMHAAFLGVVKSLLILWFSPKLSDQRWSLAKFVKLVDKRICEMTPPDFISRLPRAISANLHYMKASELKCWFYYYSIPILRSIMPSIYLKHYLLLVDGIALLNKSSISREMIDLAEKSLIEFVRRFADLYDKRYLTANLHQLLHLAEAVRDFGPLWVTSCMTFENMNGQLKTLVKGTRFAGLQICTSLSYFMAIPELIEQLRPDSIVRDFCERLNHPEKKYKFHRISSNSYAIGILKSGNEIPERISEFLELCNINCSNLGIFYRCMKNGILHTSLLYRRSKKTNSMCVKYDLNGETHFGLVVCFLRISNCHCKSYCQPECGANYAAIIKECVTSPQFPRIFQSVVTENMVAIDISNVLSVCFLLRVLDESIYIIEPVNLIEKE